MKRAEDEIQRAVFVHLRQRGAAGMLAFHVPNGGLRSKAEAAILYGLGVRAGIPDIIAIKAGHVFALELKAPEGRLTAAQEHTLREMQAAGATVAVGVGLDNALAILERWGLLRGKADLSIPPSTMGELVRRMEERAEEAKAEYRKGPPLQP